MPNLVSLEIRAADLTGPAFLSVLARAEALKQALKGAGNLGFDVTGLDSSLGLVKSKLQAHGIADLLDVNLNQGQISAQLMMLKRRISQAGISDLLDVNVPLAAAEQQLSKLGQLTETVRVRYDIAALPVLGPTRNISDKFSILGLDAAAAQLAAANAQTDALAAGFGKLEVAKDALAGDMTGKLVPAAAAARGGFGALGWVLGGLRGKVPLFGGDLAGLKIPLLAGIGGVHLLVDGVAELLAVVVPAGIALGAFGAAAVPSVQAIVSQMKNMNTVATATDSAIGPLTGGFSRMADAVRPQVYQLFGDMLTIAAKKTGEFQSLATGAGNVVDNLATRFTLAVTSGHGFGDFMKNAVPDLAKLGDIAGNLTGVLGDAMKVMPGYAQVLLTIADDASKAAEGLANLATAKIPLINTSLLGLGLAAHGALVYVGLLGTGMGALTRGGITMLGNWAERAGMAMLATDRFGAAGLKAGTAMLGFSGAAAKAAALPWGWIAAAAVGVAFLADKFITAKDATQSWDAALLNAAGSASPMHAMTVLAQAQAAVVDQLNKSIAAHAKAMAVDGGYMQGVPSRYGAASQAVLSYTNDIAAGLDTQKQLTAAQITGAGHIATLAAMYGNTTTALQLLNLAGVKAGDVNSADAATWAKVLSKVQATYSAYAAMGQQAGILGGDLNALNIMGSDQVTKMQQLNQAITGVTGIVAGGQNTFLAFETAVNGVSTAAKSAGSSMTGLNAPSLALRTAWQSAYTAGDAMMGGLRMLMSIAPGAAGATGTLTTAYKDQLGQLVKLGPLNTAQKAELVSEANLVNQNVTNWRQLTTWLGKVKDPAGALDKIFTSMGVDAQNLAKDILLINDNLQQMSVQTATAGRLAASGFGTMAAAFYKDVNQFGLNTRKAQADASAMFLDLVQSGVSVPAAVAEVLALTGKNISTGMQKAAAAAIAGGHHLTNAMKQGLLAAANESALDSKRVGDAIVGTLRASSGPAGAAGGHLGAASVNGLNSGVASRFGAMTSLFGGIPGRILGAVGGLGGLLTGQGASLIGGLIGGIESQVGSLKAVLAGITSLIPSWKGPMPKDLALLRPSGRAVMTGFMTGVASQVPAATSQLSGVTASLGRAANAPDQYGGWAAASPGAAPAGGSAGTSAAGGITVTLAFKSPSSGGSAFDKFMQTWIKENTHVLGGGNVQLAWGSGQ